jgi:glucose-1-phosphate cytidylyltransferase
MHKVVIFCGGYGTRIRDVADDIPKPLIRIGERPIVWHVMKIYAQYGLKDFVLCLGYKGWLIKEFFLNYHLFSSDIEVSLARGSKPQVLDPHSEEDWNVTLAETGQETQTAGRLAQVRKYVADSDIFCVTYGDGVSDIDIDALIAFHRSHGRIATVTGVHPPGRFGVLEVSLEQDVSIVRSFTEKPQALEGLINGGFFVFDQRVWDYVGTDMSMPLETLPLMKLAQDGQLAVYEHRGFWQPMDTYREWKLLNDLLAKQNAPWLK